MKKLPLIATILTVFAFALPAHAVESVTVTSASVGSHMVKYTIAWVADGSGNVADNPMGPISPAAIGGSVAGYIVQVAFIPDSGGTQPDSLYDVVLEGYGDTADMVGGNGANLSNTVSTTVAIAAPIYYDRTGNLDLDVSGAGADNGGTVLIWVASSQAPR